jgi:hypothetical protein
MVFDTREILFDIREILFSLNEASNQKPRRVRLYSFCSGSSGGRAGGGRRE